MKKGNRELLDIRIDEQAALAALDGSRELLRELSVMFCEDAPELVDRLQIDVESGEAAEVRRTIHSLRGLIATFFAKPSIEVAQQLEDQAARGCLEPLADGGVELLEQHVSAIIDDLKARELVS